MPQFVIGVLDGQALIQTFGGDFFGACRHRAQRRQEAFCKPERDKPGDNQHKWKGGRDSP
jgi:hypothetical protein